jgi:integrase
MKRDRPRYVYEKPGGLYFWRRPGAAVKMQAEPFTEAWWAEYALLLKGTPPPPKGKTFRALIASYKRSARYTGKAPRTRRDYDKVLAFIDDRLGGQDVGRVRRHHVVAWRDQNTGRFADYLVQVLRVLFEHAVDQGWRDDNPARGVQTVYRPSGTRQPWPEDLVATAREAATGDTLLLFELLVGTGQRIGDVLRMRWADIAGDAIFVGQSKTGAELWVPFTDRLREVLREAPRRGETILTSKRGGPLSYRAAADRMRKLRERIGAGEAHDTHALRYTTTAELAALGCDDDLIMAVTGHRTKAMVEKYAGAARQKVRAIEAQSRRK